MAGVVAASVVWSAMQFAGPMPNDAPPRSSVIPNRAVAVDAIAEPGPVVVAPAVAAPGPVTVEPEAAKAAPETISDSTPDPEAEAKALAVAAREAQPLGGSRGPLVGAEGEAAATRGWWGGSGVVQAIASTGAVIVLIFGTRWVIVRTSRSPLGAASVRSQLGAGGRAPSGLLFVLGRYPVSRGSSLVLIQLDRRVLLLSQSGAGFQTLAEIGDPEEVASIIAKARDEEGESISAKFSSLLKTFDRRHAESERDDELRSVVRPIAAGRGGPSDTVEIGGTGEDEESPEAIRDRLTALKALVS